MVEKEEFLHIYSQYAWHDPALIVGCRESLRRLAMSLLYAAASQTSSSTFDMAKDGETYEIAVICDENEKRWPVPYNADIARAKEHPYHMGLIPDQLLIDAQRARCCETCQGTGFVWEEGELFPKEKCPACNPNDSAK